MFRVVPLVWVLYSVCVGEEVKGGGRGGRGSRVHPRQTPEGYWSLPRHCCCEGEVVVVVVGGGSEARHTDWVEEGKMGWQMWD